MKSSLFGFCSLALGALLLGRQPVQALSKVVWSPIQDQNAIMFHENCPNSSCPSGEDAQQHPDFNAGQTRDDRIRIIDSALLAAYLKGVRGIDINFFAAPSTPNDWSNEAERALFQAYVQAGALWVQRVDFFNNSTQVSGADYFKLRIRVPATRTVMEHLLYRSDRTKYAQFLTIPNARLTSKSGVDMGLDPQLLDLSNATMRQYIVDYTKMVLNGVFSLRSSRTEVELVSLVLDAHGETSAWPNDNVSITSFSNSLYPYSGSFSAKAAYYKAKQGALKDTYLAFANAVKTYSYAGVARNLTPAVFMQSWAFDGMQRGAFDPVALLKGTGIGVLHHTQFPQWYDQSLRSVAYTASAARFLGKPFETEFTWPWFRDGASNSLPYDPSGMTQSDNVNADRFYFQAKAGFHHGGAGMVYCNWITRNFTTPPDVQKWDNLLGKPGAPFWNSTHLTRAGNATVPPGLLTYLPWAAPKQAIYVSTLGRVDCEEKRARGLSNGCDLSTYFDWFSKFGLDYLSNRVEILTDQMIKDMTLNTLVGGYSKICIPYETRFYTDPAVSSKLYDYWSAKGQAGIWAQTYPGSPPVQDPYPWWATTNLNYTSF